MEEPAVQLKRPFRWGKLVIILLAFILGCGLVTLSFSLVDRSGLTNPWRLLPVPATRPVKLSAGSPYEVYAQLPGGAVISCVYGKEKGCSNPLGIPDSLPPAAACPASHRAFWPITGAPEERVDCIEIQGASMEQTYDVVYVLDNQGQIWRWIALGSTNDPIILPLFCLGGAAAGFFLGLVACLIVLLAGRFAKKSNP